MKRLIGALTTANARTSAIFYIGSFFMSIGNYLFHLLLLRFLNPESYGEFLSYISFLYLITIPAGAVVTLVTKYVAQFYGQNDLPKINHFFYITTNKIVFPAFFLGLLVILSSKWLTIPFKAHQLAFIILGIHIIITFFGAIVKSYLPALQYFIYQTFIGFTDIILKLAITYILVINGWGALSGVLGIFLAGIVSMTLILIKIKPFIYPKLEVEKKIQIKFGGYAVYALILSAGSLSLMSTDVLLVRYFFEPRLSGLYSALTVLGRMIFYGLTPLSILILPIAARKFAAGQTTKNVLFKLGVATIGLGLIGVSIFSVFPEIIIRILSGSQYLEIKPWLSLFAIGMLCFAVSQMLLNYFMSVGHQKAVLIMLLATLAQPVIVAIWHANLQQIVINNLMIQVGMLGLLLMYYKLAFKEAVR